MSGNKQIWETEAWVSLKSNASSIEGSHLRELLKVSHLMTSPA